MILTRLGNKRNMATQIWSYFPRHKMRINLFFGAGGDFFFMPKAKYSILNDLDDDVTNLYLTLLNHKDELYRQIQIMPVSSSLISYWKANVEMDPVKKAIRFLLLSNFTYLGKGDTLRLGLDNTKSSLLNKIEPTFQMLGNCKITNYDFREVIDKVSFSKTVLKKDDSFVYMDPVYLDTEHYYKVPKWTEQDSFDCFEIMQNSGIKCALSEFNHPFIIDQAKQRGFQVIPMKNRQNIKNRRTEILIVNYPINQILFN